VPKATNGTISIITGLEAFTGHVYQNYFYQMMFLLHVVVGLLLIVPFVAFGTIHMLNTRNRKNYRAVRVGYVLFLTSILVLVSGVLLMRVFGLDLRNPSARSATYWLHVAAPLVAGWLYWLHRLAGPPIKWRVGLAYVGIVGAAVATMVCLHSQDPRKWNVAGPAEGEQYFQPSLARTSTGNFIPADTLMMDDYCQKCHHDVHAGWSQSAHRFSSFNNAAYLASVKETREVSLKRDGSVKASRWWRRLPRPRAVLQRRVRRSQVQRGGPSDCAFRHYLHGVPRHHPRRQHQRECRLYDRGARALSLR